MRVAVVGVGKVGLPFASYFKKHGHQVAVYDVNDAWLARISKGENPLSHEPDVVADFQMCRGLDEVLKFGPDFGPDVIFVITPTPQVGNMLSSGPVVAVLAGLDALAELEDRYTVAVVSTLDPRDAAQTCTGWKHLDVVYNPPLIRLGSVVHDIEHATIRFLGGKNVEAIEKVDRCYAVASDVRATPGPRRVSGDYLSVACAKLAINATLSARAAWGNDLARRARAIGADLDTVFAAIDAEPRVGGASYMRPGPPPGGPCLPRDLDVWAAIGGDEGLAAATQKAHDDAERALVARAREFAADQAAGGAPIAAVLGLSYKPGGLDITDSVGIAVARALAKDKFLVNAVDPVVHELARRALPDVAVSANAAQAVAASDFVVICLDTAENRAAAEGKPMLVLDFPR